MFLVPLVVGFIFNSLSAFTTWLCRHLGERNGLRPTEASIVGAGIGVVWVFVQSRLEELDLLQRLPSYRTYMRQVPRFLPRMRGGGT